MKKISDLTRHKQHAGDLPLLKLILKAEYEANFLLFSDLCDTRKCLHYE